MDYNPSPILNLNVEDYTDRINILSDNFLCYNDIKIVTLCGSVRFKLLYEYINFIFSLKGFCVFSLASFGHNALGENITSEQKKLLDKTHKSKIKHSDAIIVINPDNYVGESTRNEINYAKAKLVPIFFLE